MKVLLLGGTGTLSAVICQLAIMKGYEVSVLNRGHNNGKLPNNVKAYIGSFTDIKSLRQCLDKGDYDVVIDFLSRIPSDISRVYPIFKNHCKQFIFISSACVYRRALDDFPITEESPKPNTDWSYNVEKYECENKLKELAIDAGSFYTIVRPYITYNDERVPFGIAPSYKYHKTIIERFKAGKPWFTWNNGTAITTVTYVDDFAKGVVGLFLNNKAKNEDFHITGDFSYTQLALIEEVKTAVNSHSKIVSIPTNTIGKILPEYKNMLIGDRALDAKFCNQKIKDAVPGLKLDTSFKVGFDSIVCYWDKQGALYDYAFDARIDRMLANVGVKTNFVKYPGSENKSCLIYYIFRYFPLKIANKLMQWI